MHSTVDWFAYAVWKDGKLQRSLSLSPDSGVIEDLGTRLPFEEPLWSGERPAVEPGAGEPAYPLEFHSLELGEAVLLEFNGYQLEGVADPSHLEPEQVSLMRFKPPNPDAFGASRLGWSSVVVDRLVSSRGTPMESLLVSTGVVALAEIGDKTQLLAFILAARFKKPIPILGGILLATIVNHGLAAALGAWITTSVSPDVLRWVLGSSFIGMAIWTMVPDKIEEEETRVAKRFGVFGATLITFFLAEMGDKTQIATLALAAHYASPVTVVIGTTLGMLIADAPAVFIGDRLTTKIPMKLMHSMAAAIFALLGLATLLGAGAKLGF
jgi:putative Ca2+/H+ antiporter (TMEM165/GDT1 family)